VNILIVGADITPPWSEGRKKLIHDVAARLNQIYTVRVVTTGPITVNIVDSCSRHQKKINFSYQKITRLHQEVDKTLSKWVPDAVLHFPFGTFHGLRRIANVWSMRYIDKQCARYGLRCLTILYSITRGSLEELKRTVRELVVAPGAGWDGLTITMGTDLGDTHYIDSKHGGKPAVLFIAGLQKHKEKVLKHILLERGLEDVVKASSILVEAGVRVIVAIPLLSNSRLRNKLYQRFMKECPQLDLDLRSSISIPEIFKEIDLYLFPYRKELTQFIPTSVIEAMGAGRPVVLSDLDMFASLGNEGRTAYLFRRGDSRHLGEVVVKALSNPEDRREKACAARKFVTENWSIDKTVSDIMEILAS
jgi:glycosyltransferase involved in cell wall biosynthesis